MGSTAAPGQPYNNEENNQQYNEVLLPALFGYCAFVSHYEIPICMCTEDTDSYKRCFVLGDFSAHKIMCCEHMQSKLDHVTMFSLLE